MAEAILKKLLPYDNIEIKSAGLSALDGMEASRWAQEVMRERGMDISHHRARILSSTDVEEADLILTMSLSQKKELIERFPGADHKTFLISELAFPEVAKILMDYEKASERLQEEKARLLTLERDRLELLKRRYDELKRELNEIEKEISLILSRIEDQLSPQIMQLKKLEENLTTYEVPDPYGKGKSAYEKVADILEEMLKPLSEELKRRWALNR